MKSVDFKFGIARRCLARLVRRLSAWAWVEAIEVVTDVANDVCCSGPGCPYCKAGEGDPNYTHPPTKIGENAQRVINLYK